MFKLSEEYKAINLLENTLIIADKSAPGVSVEVYEDDALAILTTGDITSTNCTFAVNIQSSTIVGGIYTTIASFTTLQVTDDKKIAAIPVAIDGDNKVLRVNVDTTPGVAATVSGQMGVVLLVRPTVAEDGINSATAA